MPFETALHTHPDIFAELSVEWHGLLSRAQENHFFYTPEFLETWWYTLGTGRLQVISVRDTNGTLIGIAPLYISGEGDKQQLSFIGCNTVADYLDVIVQQEQAPEIYAALALVIARLEFEHLYLCSIPDNSPTRTQLSRLLAHQSIKSTQQDVCPQIQLPSTWDEYLSSLNHKQRHEVRRKMRRLERVTEHCFYLVSDPLELEQNIETFISLHKASSPEKNRFWDEQHTAFFTTLLSKTALAGWLKLFFLEISGKPAATMLIFDYNNRYYLYNSGYDPEYMPHLSAGNTLIAHTIAHAIELNKSRYDFLRGDEEYKFRLGGRPSPVWDLSNSPIS